MNETPPTPTPSPRQPATVVLRGRHDLGEIVGYAYRVYARNAPVLFALALLTVPMRLLQGVAVDRVSSQDARDTVGLLQIPATFIVLIASAAIVHAVHDFTGGTRPEFTRSLDATLERVGALFKTTLLGAMLAVLAIVAAPLLSIYWLRNRDATIDGERNWWLAIVPGVLTIYLVVRWVFVPQVVMIEGKRLTIDSS